MKKMTTSKYETALEPVTLLHINPQYCRVRQQDGRETTVSIRRLSPAAEGDNEPGCIEPADVSGEGVTPGAERQSQIAEEINEGQEHSQEVQTGPEEHPTSRADGQTEQVQAPVEPRRSGRVRRAPDRLTDYVTSILYHI